ncbi:MAG: transglutaminase-like domain-containing protein [Chloroflexi bacterium]|nr:transglutaminase-like domain-containing protein [Chloroflexota bacterium]MDA1282300.1 transglutaminase-like domain-containing protein [Chloroflexota bacterium]
MATNSLSPKENFARAIRCPDDEINLGAAALYAASSEFPDLDVIAYQGRIAQFGTRVKDSLAADYTNFEFVESMHEVLFGKAGFTGDTKDYFDPGNSHLNEVIDRLKGNPVTLSIFYIEVARVAGEKVRGISLRKHFVVVVGTGEDRIYVDPFHGGGLLSRKECITNILGKDNIKNGDFDELERKYLKPTSNRAILRRQMSNLKVAHEKHKQYELALSASERIQLVDPTNLRNLSELAHLQTKVGNFGDAVDSLTQFLERAPAGSNTEQAESALRKLKALTTRGSEDSSD